MATGGENAADGRARLEFRRSFRRSRGRGVETGFPEVLAAHHVLDDAAHHAEAGRRKADVPVDALTQITAHQRRDEGAEIDPHVIDGEACVASGIAGSVQPADDDCGVALEKSGTDHDQREPDVERGERLKGHAEMTNRDDDAPVEHRAPLTDETVRDPASRQAGHVDHRRVEAVDRAGDPGVETETARRDRRRHEQDEQRPHAVVAESFPHLGEEQRGEPAGMAEECAVVRSGRRDGNRHGGGRIQ